MWLFLIQQSHYCLKQFNFIGFFIYFTKNRFVQTVIAYISLNIEEVTERATYSESAYTILSKIVKKNTFEVTNFANFQTKIKFGISWRQSINN